MPRPSESTTSPNEQVRDGREQAQQAVHDHNAFRAEQQMKAAVQPLQHLDRMAEAKDLAQGGIAQHSASQVSELQEVLRQQATGGPSPMRQQMEGMAAALQQNKAANHRTVGEHLKALAQSIMGIEAGRSTSSSIIQDIENNWAMPEKTKQRYMRELAREIQAASNFRNANLTDFLIMIQSMVPYIDTQAPPMPSEVQAVQQAAQQAAAAATQHAQAAQAAQDGGPAPTPADQGAE